MSADLLTVLKLYLVAGELLLSACLCFGDRVAAEFRRHRPVVVLVVVVMVVTTWPLAFMRRW